MPISRSVLPITSSAASRRISASFFGLAASTGTGLPGCSSFALRRRRDTICAPMRKSCWRWPRQQDFRIGAQIVSLLRRNAKLLHPGNPVPVDAAKPKKEALMRREAADDVIGSTEREIGIRGVRAQHDQLLRQ